MTDQKHKEQNPYKWNHYEVSDWVLSLDHTFELAAQYCKINIVDGKWMMHLSDNTLRETMKMTPDQITLFKSKRNALQNEWADWWAKEQDNQKCRQFTEIIMQLDTKSYTKTNVPGVWQVKSMMPGAVDTFCRIGKDGSLIRV